MTALEQLDAAAANCVENVHAWCDNSLRDIDARVHDLHAVLSLAPNDFPEPSRVYVGDIRRGSHTRSMYASVTWPAGTRAVMLRCEEWDDNVVFIVETEAYDRNNDETYTACRERIKYDSPDVPQRVLDLVRQQIEEARAAAD